MGVKLIQTNFTGGEWSPLLEGRVDLDKYRNAVKRMENFILYPHGPATLRPGLRYIAETKTSASASRLIPFVFSADVAYMLEFGNLYIRFYKEQEQIESGGSAYEVTSPYAAADVADIRYTQSADVLYLFHPSYAPRKLERISDTSWTLSVINFKPPPTSELGLEPSATLTPSATTGEDITLTASASVFYEGDIGRVITSGTARASITGYTSSTEVIVDVIDDFTDTSAIASGSWKLNGSPSASIVPSKNSPVGAICTITSQGDTEAMTDLIVDSENCWTASGSGTNEYYLAQAASCYRATIPDKLYIDDDEASSGVLGTLGTDQWGWGDNDTLGYDTIYVRLGTTNDPDTEDVGYVKCSAVSAGIAVFRADDDDKYIRLNSGFVKITSVISSTQVKAEIIKEMTASNYVSWASGVKYYVGDLITNNGFYYRCLDDHTAGTFAIDLADGNWSLTSGFSDKTLLWTLEESVWNDTDGYPSFGTFYEDRLVCVKDENIRGSVSGDYENFTPGTDDSDSIDFTILGRTVNTVQWMEPRESLIIGTNGSEWKMGTDSNNEALTPTNVMARQQTSYGCADIMPVTVGHSTLFVQKALRKIREFTWQIETEGYVAPDLTLLAEHITASGIVEIAYQQEPLSIVWCCLTDGSLIGMTYLRDQDVIGWHKHPIDGDVESIAVIPGDGYDELWAIVERTINGATVRYVEMMGALFTDDAATFTVNKGLNAFFVDAGITYNSTAATTITGLDHLEGEEVAILADGSVKPNQTVESGQITLTQSASVVHVGLPYTALIETMRPEMGLKDGTFQGIIKRISNAIVRVHNSGTFKVGRDEDNLDPVLFRNSDVHMGSAPSLYTGDKEVGYEGEYDRDARLMIVQDKPLPLTVVAIIQDVS